MTPHKCPVCDGSGKRKRKECPACAGACVLWSKDDGEPVVQKIVHEHHHHGQPYYTTVPYYPNTIPYTPNTTWIPSTTWITTCGVGADATTTVDLSGTVGSGVAHISDSGYAGTTLTVS